jgi:glycerol-3-phosphate dehydrogenase
MLGDGERLVPGFRDTRALRVWAGVRPLFQDAKAEQVKDTRDVSRTHAVVDHRTRDGVTGLLTMSGGKLTTLRLMAQDIVDAMCEQLGDPRPSRTEHEQPPGNEGESTYKIGARLQRREETLLDEQLICECELIGRSRLEAAMRRRGSHNLDDIRRAMRLGMGPCQGGFCIYRATGILHAVDRLDGEQAADSLVGFLEERWKGVWPILYGDQLRQARLDDWIFQGLLDVEHLPGDQSRQRGVARGEAVEHDGGEASAEQVPEGGRQADATAAELRASAVTSPQGEAG